MYKIDPIIWLELNVFHQEDEANETVRVLSVSPFDDTTDAGADKIEAAADHTNCDRRKIVNECIEALSLGLCCPEVAFGDFGISGDR